MQGWSNFIGEKNLKFIVTTSHRLSPGLYQEAKRLAQELGTSYVERGDRSLADLCTQMGTDGAVVLSSDRISCVYGGCEFFFHPGLASLRIKEIKNGKTDQMIKAMSLQKGVSVLDCTLGLGTDSIVASFFTGPGGRVTGLEKSFIIAELVRRGLAAYPEEDEDIARAMRRVAVVNAGHKEYLSGLPADSYDVVYFDPMFRAPRHHSPAMNAMRALASPEPLDPETIELALRAAAKRVVLKERRGSTEFERLGFKKVFGGKYAPVAYGVIERRVAE